MINKRYLLCPGWITSQYDGQRRYITAMELTLLYNVPMKECIIADYSQPELDRNFYRGLIPLYPRYHGDYRAPQQERGY